MAVDIESLGIARLSVAERLELIEKIWDTLPEQVGAGEVPEWHLDELARRRSRAEAEPGVGRRWQDVLGSREESP